MKRPSDEALAEAYRLTFHLSKLFGQQKTTKSAVMLSTGLVYVAMCELQHMTRQDMCEGVLILQDFLHNPPKQQNETD